MAAMVSSEIPREVLHATRMTPDELRRELASMSPGDFQPLLGSWGIPVHFDQAEYLEDLKTLEALGPEEGRSGHCWFPNQQHSIQTDPSFHPA